MIICLIGHRGVGKSALLNRLKQQKAFESSRFFDLDQEVEKNNNMSVADFIATYGLSRFREEEERVLSGLCASQDKNIFVALGAGYQGALPRSAWKVWVQRPTDPKGRVFLDRPRLQPEVPPLVESQKLWEERESKYAEQADEVYSLLEGNLEWTPWESCFWENKTDFLPFSGGISILPNMLEKAGFDKWLKRRLEWGFHFFELRTDWLQPTQIEKLFQQIPAKKILLSLRTRESEGSSLLAEKGLWGVDWPLELGPEPLGSADIVSLHERSLWSSEVSLLEVLDKFTSYGNHGYHLKLAVEIESLEELLIGHKWWQQDPMRRSFLPRTRMGKDQAELCSGKWQWYRALMGGSMKLHFVREGRGPYMDQPFVAEAWKCAFGGTNGFAAVLGSPVLHSWTPVEQQMFFDSTPVVAIDLDAKEWTNETLQILRQLGLQYAAITSPLKEKTFVSLQGYASLLSGEATQWHSVNTLKWSDKSQFWQGTNTDGQGLGALLKEVQKQFTDLQADGALEASLSWAVWGGGGTRKMIQAHLPQAIFYSARTGKELIMKSELGDKSPSPYNLSVSAKQNSAPEVLIWAVGRERMDQCQWPPESWQPKYVVDLNYAEDSPGREYALKAGSQYISGLSMFKAQAQGQREFWQSSNTILRSQAPHR